MLLISPEIDPNAEVQAWELGEEEEEEISGISSKNPPCCQMSNNKGRGFCLNVPTRFFAPGKIFWPPDVEKQGGF